MNPYFAGFLSIISPIFANLLLASASLAGLSAENVIVVVNADSVVSRTIANHYVQARDIPSANVVQLSGVPTDLKISLEDFKSKILNPLLEQLNKRRLAAQTRVIAYSADFPTTVDVSKHREQITDETVKKYQSGSASLNGATFFYRFILADRGDYLHWGSNMYARGRFERHFLNPFVGEKKDQFQQAKANLADGRHLEAAESLAKMFAAYPTMSPLAIMAARGYSLADKRDDAVDMLRRGIQAGWWSAEYLKQDEALAKLLDDSQLAKLLPLLTSAPIALQGPVGFAPHRGWTASGHPTSVEQGGMPYLLSCSLAVVREHGSTIDQAVNVLQRASAADRTYPQAEFRFAANGDVRAKTRFPQIADALVYLQEAGHQTDVFRSVLPTKAGDVAGLMVGRAVVDLKNQPWRLVPGAIAENLTSFGGVFGVKGHTKITEFLHAGAAISSGTVAEPFAIPFKFPLPIMYGYYADGVSAIEAFYLSVMSPYQLLIVGDPLCQPFARPPADLVDISQHQQPNKIVITRRPLEMKGPQTLTRSMEFYIGGRFVKATVPGKNATIDLTKETSGEVEVRVVLVGHDPTEPRLTFTKYVDTNGPLPTPQARITKDRDQEDQQIRVEVECEKAESISLTYFGDTVGMVQGESGLIEFDATPLGDGPIRLQPLARFSDKVVPGQPIVVGL